MKEKFNQDPNIGYDVVSSLLYSRPRTPNKLCPCQKFLYVHEKCYYQTGGFVVKLICGRRERRGRTDFGREIYRFYQFTYKTPLSSKRLFKLFMSTRAVI